MDAFFVEDIDDFLFLKDSMDGCFFVEAIEYFLCCIFSWSNPLVVFTGWIFLFTKHYDI